MLYKDSHPKLNRAGVYTMTVLKVKLSNGVIVANFSSPHPFLFEDDTTLPGHSPEDARKLALRAEDIFTPRPGGPLVDVDKKFAMSPDLQDELDRLEADPAIDIIIVPFPVLSSIKESGRAIGKARTIFTTDRITKKCSISKFCR